MWNELLIRLGNIQDMATDFHANLEVWYSHKDRKTAKKNDLYEERTYTFYDFKDE